MHDLDEKIIVVCKVEDIEKEIENVQDLKMRVMDAIEAIPLGTTPTTLLNSSLLYNLVHEPTPFLFLLHHLDRLRRVNNNRKEIVEMEQKLQRQLERNCQN